VAEFLEHNSILLSCNACYTIIDTIWSADRITDSGERRVLIIVSSIVMTWKCAMNIENTVRQTMRKSLPTQKQTTLSVWLKQLKWLDWH